MRRHAARVTHQRVCLRSTHWDSADADVPSRESGVPFTVFGVFTHETFEEFALGEPEIALRDTAVRTGAQACALVPARGTAMAPRMLPSLPPDATI